MKNIIEIEHNTHKKLSSIQQGQLSEQLALNYLQAQGLKLLTKNYRCKLGEIDLIMQDAQAVVFIEVRFRKNDAFGNGGASVTNKKQLKIIKTASLYLQKNYKNSSCRFDVVDVSYCRSTSKNTLTKTTSREYFINWVRDAFLPC